MAVALHVGDVCWEVGSPDFLNAFFSTTSHHLEPEGFGSRFPTLMKDLYGGRLASDLAGRALRELEDARDELRQFAPDHVVWDRENLIERPPWGSKISAWITDLSNYFVSSDGRDLIDVLQEALVESQQSRLPLRIE